MKVKPSRRAGEVVMELGRRDEELLSEAAAPEFKIKRILVPIDFSECSKKALKYALALARQHSAALDLLHVVPSPPYDHGEFGPLDYVNLQKELEASAANELGRTIAEQIGPGTAAGAIIRVGGAGREIVEVARNIPTDLIVISTHVRSGLKHVLLGSVAEQVVRHAPCPVLVVRESQHEFLAR